MVAVVTSYEDSIGVRLPKSLWENVRIAANDKVDVWVKGNSIMIKRQEEKGHLTTKERIAAFYSSGEDANLHQLSEVDWGKPLGEEAW